MQVRRILVELRAERLRLDRAIAALQGITNVDGTRSAKPPRRRRMTAAGRKRLSELMKKRWASGKMRKTKKRAA
jgi:hypothetical protein